MLRRHEASEAPQPLRFFFGVAPARGGQGVEDAAAGSRSMGVPSSLGESQEKVVDLTLQSVSWGEKALLGGSLSFSPVRLAFIDYGVHSLNNFS